MTTTISTGGLGLAFLIQIVLLTTKCN
jgi:hypothetical protein